MSDLKREFSADLAVRSDSEGRTIHGIIVPFGQVARVSDGGPAYDETFQAGAFSKAINEGTAARVKLMTMHDYSKLPIGRAVLLREDSAGLYGEFKVADTQAGNEALALVRDGALDSFSIGFRPVKHVKRGAVTVRTEVAIREASLVTFPAYPAALVGGVRFTPEELGLLRNLLSSTPVVEPGDEATPDDGAGPLDEPLRAALDGLSPKQRLAFARMRRTIQKEA